jgi:hypothetical protein
VNTLFLVSFLVSSIVTGANSSEMALNRTNNEVTQNEEETQSISEPINTEEQQDAVLQFINVDVAAVSTYEVQAFDSLASVSGANYTDDKTMYLELVETTIPAYEKAMAQAKTIDVQGEELVGMKKQIVKATETFYEGLILQRQALEQQDENLMTQSNLKLEEYFQLVDAYHAEMGLLSKKYDIEYKDAPNTPKQSEENFL